MDATPALQPPAGLSSNFVDPPNPYQSYVVGTAFIVAITSLFVVLRLFTRAYIVRKVHLEDYFCALAWALLVTYAGVVLSLQKYGFSRHQWDITVPMLSHIAYWVNIVYIIYGPTALLAKLAVLYQFKRIFVTKRDTTFWVVYISIAYNVVFYTGVFFACVFQCWPREAIWNPEVAGICTDGESIDLASGILNLFSDIEALILPAWAIWHLKMPIKKKALVFAAFSVGIFAVAVGVVGMYYRARLLVSADFTWEASHLAMLAVAEMAVVIIVGCAPSLPRFWHFCTNGFSRREKNSTRSFAVPSRNIFLRKRTVRGEDSLLGLSAVPSAQFGRVASYDAADPESARASPMRSRPDWHQYGSSQKNIAQDRRRELG